MIETYQWSTKLDGSWLPSNATVTITPGATAPSGPDYETVVVTGNFDPSTTSKLFIRLKVTEEP